MTLTLTLLALHTVGITAWALCYKHILRRDGHPLAILPLIGAVGVAALTAWTACGLDGGALQPRVVGYGACAGVAVTVAVLSYFYVIKHGARLGVSWTIITLSMTIPVAASLVVWGEIPTALQALGIAVAVGGILLLGRVRAGGAHMPAWQTFLLLVAFVCSGASAVFAKAQAEVDGGEVRDFLLAMYGVMLLAGAGGLLLLRRLPRRVEYVGGVIDRKSTRLNSSHYS